MKDNRKTDVTISTIAFMLCSSSMLVMNKVAVTMFPAPTILLFLQLLSTVGIILCFSKAGALDTDRFERSKMVPFIGVSIAFLSALYTNIKTLQYANVETFVVFRSSTPVLISMLEFIFLGRKLPSVRSFASLIGMLIGAIAYMRSDSCFEVKAYTWVVLWYFVFCFDQIFIKHIVETVDLTPWGRTLYTNSLALPWVICACFVSSESTDVIRNMNMHQNFESFFAVFISCTLGVLMSYTSFRLRKLVSATTFTLIGTTCKVLSIFINFIIWDKHATDIGLYALSFCMISAMFYEQAPMRNTAKA